MKKTGRKSGEATFPAQPTSAAQPNSTNEEEDATRSASAAAPKEPTGTDTPQPPAASAASDEGADTLQTKWLPFGRAKGQPEATSARRRPPKNNVEIAILARRKVRSMINVLNEIAKDKEGPAGSRVSAAKALIDYAKLEPKHVQDLTDEQVRQLATHIMRQRMSKADAKRVEAAVSRQAAADNIH